MTALTHRERVMMALNHKEPDRVPLAAYAMTDICYTNLRKHLSLPPEVSPENLCAIYEAVEKYGRY